MPVSRLPVVGYDDYEQYEPTPKRGRFGSFSPRRISFGGSRSFNRGSAVGFTSGRGFSNDSYTMNRGFPRPQRPAYLGSLLITLVYKELLILL